MKNKTITQFLEEDFSPAALYLNYRTTPSLIDGLKNSHRKIIYTLRKKNIKTRQKVSQFASLVAAETDYLHGEVSLAGAITSLGQNYSGTNNLPLLVADGNFGTRFSHEASATRYIYTYPQKYFDNVFRKEDDCNLITQIFEGEEIEPRFFVPAVPLILINGCTGIGVGFASKILCRSTENMIKAIRCKLQNQRLPEKLFFPAWNNFNGTIVSLGPCKWQVVGSATITGKRVNITELPVSYDLMGYITVLKKLKEKGVITKFTDSSEDDKFQFEVILSPEEITKSTDEILSDLKLVVTYSESLTCLDENNAICEFNSVKEIFERYYAIRMEYLEKRLKSEIARLTQEASDAEEVMKFIQEVIKGTINLKDKRANVEKCLKDKGYTLIEKLLSMPLHSITDERAAEIKNKYEAKVKELEEMKKQTPTSLWMKDLDDLEKAIKDERRN